MKYLLVLEIYLIENIFMINNIINYSLVIGPVIFFLIFHINLFARQIVCLGYLHKNNLYIICS